MSNENEQNDAVNETSAPADVAVPEVADTTAAPASTTGGLPATPPAADPTKPFADSRGPRGRGGPGGQGGQRGRGQGGPGGQRGRGPRKGNTQRSEYDQRLLGIRRVARVSAGGRRFNFSVVVVIGNRKGSVGVGLGKAGDTSLAIDKAVRDAKKNIVIVPLTKTSSITHDVEAKYCSARVVMFPSNGRGLVAGSAIRDVLELAGITDINAKILSGSKNKLNMARAATAALAKVRKTGESAQPAPEAAAEPVTA
jgi:small subunit ribosomal protein S5